MENGISRDGFHEGLSNKWCCHCTRWFFLFRHFQSFFYPYICTDSERHDEKQKKNTHTQHISSFFTWKLNSLPFACWYFVLSLMNRAFPTFNSICFFPSISTLCAFFSFRLYVPLYSIWFTMRVHVSDWTCSMPLFWKRQTVDRGKKFTFYMCSIFSLKRWCRYYKIIIAFAHVDVIESH